MSDRFHDQLITALPKLRAAAVVLTRNRSAADDLVQETAVRALRARGSFEIGTNFGAWVHRILHNSFITSVRRNRETALEDVPPEQADRAFTRPVAEDRLAARELSFCMNRLSPMHRQSLVMIVLEGLSYEEVARRTGVAVGTAKCRVFRARRLLERMMLGEDEAASVERQRQETRARVSRASRLKGMCAS